MKSTKFAASAFLAAVALAALTAGGCAKDKACSDSAAQGDKACTDKSAGCDSAKKAGCCSGKAEAAKTETK